MLFRTVNNGEGYYDPAKLLQITDICIQLGDQCIYCIATVANTSSDIGMRFARSFFLLLLITAVHV